ncbi:MAG TPA: AraC family transcriptional regulator, partial [Porticoccus sp.]|nr:AraC family transcriptional regulator [Porticoccus sp.]
KILLEHQPIHKLKDYRHWFGVNPVFGASNNAVIYPATLSKQTIPQANPDLYLVLKRHIRELAEAEVEEQHLINFVRNNISRGINQGTATLEHIAAEINIEARTLQRRLKQEGTSFQQLVNEVRLSRGKYYLEKTRLSITDIALELGYAEASVFVRAFKRLTKLSPKQYRNLH